MSQAMGREVAYSVLYDATSVEESRSIAAS